MLPVYTSYLRPADYGAIAILDLTAGVLGILIGAGMGSAVTRYHFEAKDELERDRVWWTGLTFVVLLAIAIVFPAWLFRDALAHLTLGPTVALGGFYYALILPTLWFSVIEQMSNAYLRVRKWSTLSVGINLTRLVVNIGLNVYFLAVLNLGVTGVLLGNLMTGGVTTLVLLSIFSRSRGAYTFHWPLVRPLWNFGGPLVVTAILSTVMHQADRYLLRLHVSIDQIGVYSLAYSIGQAVNTLCLLPFASIWSVLIYEIASQPNAKHVYARVFQYVMYGTALLMFGVSLFSRPLLELMVETDYLQAAELIPIVCLAYLFFSLHEHFKVPVMLAKRTAIIPFVVAVAAATNIVANLLLIPWLGPAGAAWASVATFATYSFVGLWRYRRIDAYAYPFRKCALVLTGMIVSSIAHYSLVTRLEQAWSLGIAAMIWLAWAVTLFGPLGWRCYRSSAKNRAA